MTQAAEDAVLRPVETGASRIAVRAALAARVAALHGEEAMAEHYRAGRRIRGPARSATRTTMEPAPASGNALSSTRSRQGRGVAAADIAALQAAEIADADIVRLAELVAFMAYQLRLIAGASA